METTRMETVGRSLARMSLYYRDDRVEIYNGDALQLIPEVGPIGGLITDPPYSSGGQFRGDRTRTTVEKYVQTGTAAYRPDFGGDSRDQRGFLAWSSLWLNAAYNIADESAIVACFIDWRQLPVMTDAIQSAGWVWRGIAVWDKGFGRPRNGGFSSATEFVVWGSKGSLEPNDRYGHGIHRSPTPKDRQHITQKPEAVMAWLLDTVSRGKTILDPFCGSGTTLKVAKELGHQAIGIEADPDFCRVSADRVAQTLPLEQIPEKQMVPDWSLFDD